MPSEDPLPPREGGIVGAWRMLPTGLSRGGRGERFFAPPHNVILPSGDDLSFGGGATCVVPPCPHGVVPQYENTFP